MYIYNRRPLIYPLEVTIVKGQKLGRKTQDIFSVFLEDKTPIEQKLPYYKAWFLICADLVSVI